MYKYSLQCSIHKQAIKVCEYVHFRERCIAKGEMLLFLGAITQFDRRETTSFQTKALFNLDQPAFCTHRTDPAVTPGDQADSP